MNKKILRYLGAAGLFSMSGFVLYVLSTVLYVPATTDFSKIMKPVDIVLFIAVASIAIGIGIGCLKEEIFPNEIQNSREVKE